MNILYSQLDDLYKLQLAAKELQHGIKKEEWEFFEPSRFVYAFFAFNSFYSINWEESEKEQSIVKWEHVNTGQDSVKTESQKISEMRKFIYNSYINESMSNNEKEDIKDEFAKRLSRKLKCYLKQDVNQTIESLKGIVPDINIDCIKRDKFIEEFGSLLNNELKGKKLQDALDTTLKFVFSVRNNIFHGTKTMLDMRDKGQQVRLKVYTAILLSINEMLFEVFESRFQWDKKKVDSSLYRRRDHRNRPFSYSQTVASKFDISIPEGPLFYPCVGDDTSLPIRLFIDSVSEFHFVDSRLVPRLPRLEVELTGYSEHYIERRRLSGGTTNPRFVRDLISSARAFEPYDDKIEVQKINDLIAKGIKFAGYDGHVGKIYKQEWQLVKGNKKIEIYRHLQDGLATFISLDKVAVFFLRRDSEGGGGSSQFWFQEKLLNIILEKLMDGGLIVTDGSGFDHTSYDNAQWRSLWSNRFSSRQGVSIIDKPSDFEYYGRNFECLGECAIGYGPVYVWQVTWI